LLADEPTGNLDTATTNEIVEILGTLGEDEVTVVLITHAVEVAERAKRRVALRDGKIVSDSASS
ncbi:MAG TPA: macrolide ABC transporter ATP-binding protein, partial [Acidimicrobiales bacterium]|nr:macrolide ABC transporter ATP-binding protein [Acidimicrobiales bacterium]